MKYDAFGKITWLDENFNEKTNSDYSWNRTFTGQVLDSETGLMLYRNRYYHVELGRFVNRDPIEYGSGDHNIYRYVNNSPVLLFDPTGLVTVCGPRVLLYTGRWCVDESIWDAAIDAAGEVVICWWQCEIKTHDCVLGKILTTTEVVSGTWSVVTSRKNKLPHEITNPKDPMKGVLRAIIRKIPGGRGSKSEKIARALLRGKWRVVSIGAKGSFTTAVIAEAVISISCGFDCSGKK
jgi:RHS repeat-associated protein